MLLARFKVMTGRIFMVSIKKILLFYSILCGAILLAFSTQLFSQHGMNVTVRTESGEDLDLYKDSYALVIGNGFYPEEKGWHPLPGAVEDVMEVAEVLERQGFEVTLKIDVTKSEFTEAFSEFIYESGENKDNRLLFYYAGHGYTTKAVTGEDLGYLVMLDTPSPENAAAFDLYSVDMVKFVSDSKKIHAKHVLFIFDTCFSSTVLNLGNSEEPPFHITDEINNSVRQFITAGRTDEPMPDRSKFKKAFLDLLGGRVAEPSPDGYLTGVELANYLYRTVPKFSPGQQPQYGKINDPQLNTGNFVFVIPKSGIELDTIATLNITSTPSGATVYVDSITIGTTPIHGYQIDTGVRLEKEVNVGLELSGYKSRVKKMTLRGGQQFPWAVHLEEMVPQTVLPKSDPDVPETTVEEVEKDLNAPQTIVGNDGAEMVLIPAGNFEMGHDGNANTKPVHTVYIDAFYIDKYEVTVGQYNQFVLATGHSRIDGQLYQYSPTDQHPVVGVTWHDAMAYAKWAGKRLPTEAEWEKAARGGLVRKWQAWGDAALDGTQCNFADMSLGRAWQGKWEEDWSDKNLDDGFAFASPVGSYPPNGYGLYDMAGNVWEYCFDAYDKNFYANSPRRNPVAQIIVKDGQNNIVAINKLRVSRGASWYDAPSGIWVASRLGVDPRSTAFNRGFRCAKSVDP